MRILLVSQMYPSAAAPDFGVFVQGLERALAARGHELERVVLDRRGGGKLRHARLAARAVRAARRFRPDVVYAHFLFPTGLGALLAARASRAPLVVTAHGQDVANLTEYPFVRPPARRVVRGAAAVIAVSDWLRGRLERARSRRRAAKTEVVDCGVDLERFRLLERAPGAEPAFVCVGSLIERKNVVRLARRLRAARRGDADVRRRRPAAAAARGPAGRRRHRLPPARRGARLHLAAADVLCQPSLVEPFGQAALEALACGAQRGRDDGRRAARVRPARAPACSSIRSTRTRSPQALRAAAALPVPNAAARAAAELHDVRLQAAGWRRFSSEPFEIGEPDLDERPDRLLDPGLARQLRAPARSSRAPSRARRPASAGCPP